ncbi:hypothetical protein BSKO_08912 [Bryopsis sp. KO-2023]|nr:hypothetical protein BSKO_08912 [Bryopsis sp. KO-2023]
MGQRTAPVACVLLVFLWHCGEVAAQSSANATGFVLRPTDFNTMGTSDSQGFVACTANIEPLVECNPERPQETYSGYHIELFREAAAKIGLQNFTIKCLPFDEMLQDLLQGGKKCDIGAGAITLSTDRADRGIKFTHPTYRGSLGVLIKAQVQQGSTWGFLKPLHWTVWLATGLTSLVVPIVVFAVDALANESNRNGRMRWGRMRVAVWESLSSLMQCGSFTVRSQSARIIVLGYAFMILIIINTYVANLAAFLTITNIDSTVRSVSDLIGKNVGTGTVYMNRLRRNGIVADTFASSMKAQAARELQLGQNNYDAVVYDEPWITFVAATWGCDLLSLKETFEPFDYAYALPRSANRILEEQFSRALVVLQEEGVMARLKDKFVGIEISDCPTHGEVSDTVAVRFNQLVGLWIVLGICFALSVVFLVGKWLRIAWAMTMRSGGDGKEKNLHILQRLSTLKESATNPKEFVSAFRQASAKFSETTEGDLAVTLKDLVETLDDFKAEQEKLRNQVKHISDAFQSMSTGRNGDETRPEIVVQEASR